MFRLILDGLLITALTFSPTPVSKPETKGLVLGCVVIETHDQIGSCVTTTRTICCNGPESCVVVREIYCPEFN